MDDGAEVGAQAASEEHRDLVRAMVPTVRRLIQSVVIAGVLPAIAYGLIRSHVHSDATALEIIMVFPLADIAYERIRVKRFEPIGMIVLLGIGTGLVGAVLTHGALMLKVRDAFFTGLFGLICLISLPLRRPVMYYLGRAFATGGDAAKKANFDEMVEIPGVRRRFKVVTATWGFGLFGEACLRTVFALTLSTQMFLWVSQVASVTTLVALFWFTIMYTRAGEHEVERLLATPE